MSDTPNRCACGAGGAPKVLFAIETSSPSPGVRMMRCPACGSLYPDRLPQGADAYRGYYTRAPPRAPWRRWLRTLADLTRRAYVDRAVPPDAERVLDFGCGAGEFPARVAARNRVCFGTDLIAPDVSGAGWLWLDPDRLAGAAPFDWITLGHVLEHVDEPSDLIERLAAMLAPGGGLWIATPNADSFLFRLAGAGARDVDYPRHREIFARSGLARLLAGAGLAVEFRSPPRLNALLNTLATVANIARDARTPRGSRAAVVARTLVAFVMHLLTARSRRDRESPELVVVCRVRSAR